MSADDLARFDTGKDDFSEEEDVDDGLGPVFNERGCAVCHSVVAVGGSSPRAVTRFGRLNADGSFDPLAELGGSLRQDHGIGDVDPEFDLHGENVPENATVTAHRRTTALWGFGLIEAVPDAELRAIAALQPAAIRGLPNELVDAATGQTRIGRFGWKAQVATLLTFAGDAYLNEMGITNPVFPNENCPQGDCSLLATFDTVPDPEDSDGTSIRNFEAFMQLLAPPQRTKPTFAAVFGELVFANIGCAGCHTPVLVTGPSAVPQIANKVIQPFSDFLLHDMGALGDGITQGNATGSLMKTPPLWGVSSQQSFLHDGRATTLDDAILAHDGQGRAARDRFGALDPARRAAVIAFLRSL